MIVYQIRKLCGRLLFNGRHIKKRTSDKNKRIYDKMRNLKGKYK